MKDRIVPRYRPKEKVERDKKEGERRDSAEEI